MSLDQDSLKESSTKKSRSSNVKKRKPLRLKSKERKRKDIPSTINEKTLRAKYGKSRKVLFHTTLYANGQLATTTSIIYDGSNKYGCLYLESRVRSKFSHDGEPKWFTSPHRNDWAETKRLYPNWVKGMEGYMDTANIFGRI